MVGWLNWSIFCSCHADKYRYYHICGNSTRFPSLWIYFFQPKLTLLLVNWLVKLKKWKSPLSTKWENIVIKIAPPSINSSQDNTFLCWSIVSKEKRKKIVRCIFTSLQICLISVCLQSLMWLTVCSLLSDPFRKHMPPFFSRLFSTWLCCTQPLSLPPSCFQFFCEWLSGWWFLFGYGT